MVKNYNLSSKKINNEISAKEVRLTDYNGKYIGIVSIIKAMKIAESSSLDLVEINNSVYPPICKILNYSKFLYEKIKSNKKKRKNQKFIQIKEIKFRPNIEKEDYKIKLRNIIRFLNGGNKVKITLRFKGREMIHKDIGINIFNRIKKDLKSLFKLNITFVKTESRQIIMILSVKKK
ncbi:MAG: translation initiation factor IF-3 [Enterobacteriaceae bacterium]